MSSSRRHQHVPWNAAGRAASEELDADRVVRETGWVFNNATGEQLTLAEFVDSGEQEVGAYLECFGLAPEFVGRSSLVEIGSGIGRMTAGFSRRFAQVTACDLDASFLEQCRDTVGRFGESSRLRTSHVADGRTLDLADESTDVAFSYITLQHCDPLDALHLTREAVRITRPGGVIALNYRTWTPYDLVLYPAGVITRLLWRIPRVGPWLSRRRWSTRLGWQANRLTPRRVRHDLERHGIELDDPTVWRRRARRGSHFQSATFGGIHHSHWWLIARRPTGVHS